MLLSDRDLRAAIATGRIGIEPFESTLVQPASIDVRLDAHFRVFTGVGKYVDPRNPPPDLTEPVWCQGDEPFVLTAGSLALGSTLETLTVSAELAVQLNGKSSLGRLGLAVHVTAGFVDPGFCGQLTLELSNLSYSPILLWPGMPIAQLAVFELSSAAVIPYGSPVLGSRYQGQCLPTPALPERRLSWK